MTRIENPRTVGAGKTARDSERVFPDFQTRAFPVKSANPVPGLWQQHAEQRMSEKSKRKSGVQRKNTEKSILRDFDLDDPKLPKSIADEALSSGGYPHDEKMSRGDYREALRPLQIELVKLQKWAREQGKRIVLVFEGRDAAGKGGTIKAVTENMNPRSTRIVALSKPSETERGQWYFQR